MSCCRQNPGTAVGVPLDPPVSLPTPAHWPKGLCLDELGLARMPRRKDGTTVRNQSSKAEQNNLKNNLNHASVNVFFVFSSAFRLTGQRILERPGILVKEERKPV